MNHQGIDEEIRQVFEAGDFEYNPANWEALRNRMDGKPGRKVMLLPLLSWKTGIAACLAAALGCFLLYTLRQPAEPLLVIQPQSKHIPATPQVQQPVQQETVQNAQPTSSIKSTLSTNTAQTLAARPTIQKTSAADTAATPVIASAQIPAQQPLINTTIATRTPTEQEVNDQHDQAFRHFPELPPERQKDPATALGLTGGYNRGNANSGFALGINASTRISGRLSLEGDIAYIRNNNPTSTSDVSDVQYKSMSSGFSEFSNADAIEKIDISTLSRISYLQFSPSLSYRLGSRLHLGLGMDIQQMLPQDNNNDNVIYLKNYDMKILPRTDIGYTGKVNYSISSRLKAGLQYREGLQAALDKTYFNRRYMQFTLQYAFLQR